MKKKQTHKQIFLTQPLPSGSERNNQFHFDMCKAFAAANIPWNVIENPTLKSFLEKYCHEKIPSESTLRKNYLEKVYDSTLDKIRSEIGDSCIWVSVDETTDSLGRSIANLIVGKLDEEKPQNSHLIYSREMEKTNANSVAYFVNSGLKLLYPNGVKDEKVLILYTDAAAYMLAAGKLLKVFFQNLIHVTCLAHALHRVAEEIRNQFPKVNDLISSVKKVFLKSSTRVAAFKEKCPNLPLPPAPILTRWGTWLQAVQYYSENIQGIADVVNSFSEDDSQCIKMAQSVLREKKLKEDLAYIRANFTFLANSIKQLESSKLSLTELMAVFNEAKCRLKKAGGNIAEIVLKKLQMVIDRNPGYTVLKSVSDIMNGCEADLPEGFNPVRVSLFKYAPVTSADVERSFSAFKLILSSKRHKLTTQHLEMLLVIYCAQNYDRKDSENDNENDA